MPNGAIKFFNAAKGFGFVTPDEGGKDVFVPAASVTAAGISALTAGQRISFEMEPDTKGPKAVGLKLLASAPPPPKMQRTPPTPAAPAPAPLTFYYDPSWEKAAGILEELDRAKLDVRLVNYIAAAPDREELKRLSVLLRGGNQPLVRQYDPLFLALNLDDRFISENDYWDAVVEHPSLINGPLLATAAKAIVCQSRDAAKAFLAAGASSAASSVPEKKNISSRLLQMLGGASPVPPVVEEAVPQIPEPKIVKPAASDVKPVAVVKPLAVVKKAKAAPRSVAKVVVKAKPAKPAPKPAKAKKPSPAKAKQLAKKVVRSPVKKKKRA